MKFLDPGRYCSGLLCGALACLLFFSGCASRQPVQTHAPKGFASNQGEFGADLSLLSQRLREPANSRESNYFLDIWGDGELQNYARAHGLTNNHAFFVISHGGGIQTAQGLRYAYYPDSAQEPAKKKNYFSARDLAQVLGPRKVATIHNLVIAGCNWDNSFSSAELRQFFPNATNIVHSLPGRNAHETLLRHALIYPSKDIRTLYLQPDFFQVGQFGEKWREKKAQPYIAELFLPGQLFPYRIQTAGRELLEHGTRFVLYRQAGKTPSTRVN